MEVGIEVPTRVTEEQREIIEQLAQTLGEAPTAPTEHDREPGFIDKLKSFFQ